MTTKPFVYNFRSFRERRKVSEISSICYFWWPILNHELRPWPILFMLYTSPIGDIVRSYDINFHLYGDDSQLYITFSTSSMSQLDNAKWTLEACVTEIDKWMLQNSLKMNGDKTETILLSSSFRPRPSIDSVSIAGHDVFLLKKLGILVSYLMRISL